MNNNKPKIKKAVITCGGYATRFLPITKAIPKEMLPIGNRPVIHYILDELSQAGITEVLLLIGRGREILQNYLDKNYEVDDFLEKTGNKTETNFFDNLNIFYRRVPMPRGIADCLSYAEKFAGGEDFILCFCDDIFFESNPTAELLADYNKNKRPAVLGGAVLLADAHRYGIISAGGKITEKPHNPESNIAAVGRYLLTPKIFQIIKTEKDMTAALNKLNPKSIVITNAVRFDAGSKDGFYNAFKYVMEKC
jgi:UTP--glucose-1-phosphate uridylyltransferase